MATAEQTKPVFSWKQKERAPEPPPEASKREAFVDHNGRRIRLTADCFSGKSWMWGVDFQFPPYLSVNGTSPDVESAQNEAQAVVDLFATGRPLYLDRTPMLSTNAAPGSGSSSAQGIGSVCRQYRSFSARTVNEVQEILDRLDAAKNAAHRLYYDYGDHTALEAVRILDFLAGERQLLALLKEHERRSAAVPESGALAEGKNDGL